MWEEAESSSLATRGRDFSDILAPCLLFFFLVVCVCVICICEYRHVHVCALVNVWRSEGSFQKSVLSSHHGP